MAVVKQRFKFRGRVRAQMKATVRHLQSLRKWDDDHTFPKVFNPAEPTWNDDHIDGLILFLQTELVEKIP